ncbi:MAG: transcription antitermination factor NusB [Gemmatimonadetes bacterium]|nr:MAG: transcription antitermination factor NusB [Gemmatimonadota bacterium]
MQRPETKARARALQLLYAWELSGRPTIETVIARVAVIHGRAPRGVYDRGADLAAKAIAGLPEFDRRIADAAEHWRLERVGAIERNILRLALAELDEASTPSRVVIDEAVKLAHWFAGSRAPAFINGVLDAIAHETGAL